MAVTIGAGWTVGPGWSLGDGSGGGGGAGIAGVDGTVGYNEMPPPVVAGQALEDLTATINSPTGFTINDDTKTGVAMIGLTLSNVNWFAANYAGGPQLFSVTFGPGSTVANGLVLVVQIPSGWPGGGPLTFFVQGQTGAATYNYPFTFS
jgi:hypothetical protein